MLPTVRLRASAATPTDEVCWSGVIYPMRFFVLALALMLTACSNDGVTVTREQATVPYLEVHVRFLGSLGAVETTVLANPFPADGDGAAVRRILSAARVEPYIQYRATRPANDQYGYRLVVAFGRWPIGGDNYCRNPGLTPRPAPPDVTELHMVLCLGTRVLTESSAHTRRIASTDDPRFARLVADLLVGLMVTSQHEDIESPSP